MAAFVRGLLAPLPRVNCWTIAEHAGEACPRGMQRLLSEAVWDDAGMRDDLRGYVLEHFADPGAVLVVDETGDLKKGTATVGTQRQYTGTAGRTENAQVAVYLAYAAPAGSAFIDRALYLPRSWQATRRCQAAGVPKDTAFATKPALARQMITGALDAGTPAAWATADEVYGQDPQLRAELARRGLGYVLAIPRRHLITTPGGGWPAIALAKRLPARAWQRLPAGPGAKGPRWYDWALIDVADPAVTEGSGPHWLLVRRQISDGEYAFYRAHAPGPVPLAQLVRVAGSRWKVECCAFRSWRMNQPGRLAPAGNRVGAQALRFEFSVLCHPLPVHTGRRAVPERDPAGWRAPPRKRLAVQAVGVGTSSFLFGRCAAGAAAGFEHP